MKHAGLLIALCIQLAVSFSWSRLTPVFEAPDEFAHAELVQRHADGAPLAVIPGTAAKLERPFWTESALAHHPPLYYALLGWAVRWTAPDGLRPTPISKERARDPAALPNTLRWAHGFDEVSVSREVRRFRRLRTSSVIFGALSLLLTYGLARRAAPQHPGVATTAVCLLASVPTWTFSHGVLDNGNLAVLLCLGTLFLLCAPPPDDPRRRDRARVLLIGLCLSAALATKLTALFLPGVVLGAWWLGRLRASQAVFVLTLGALALGPFIARNLDLYGEPLGSAAHAAAFEASRIPEGQLGNYLIHLLPTSTARTLLLRVGANDLHQNGYPIPTWFPIAFAALLLLAITGAFLPAQRRRRVDGKSLVLLALGALGCAAIYLKFNLVFRQAQGRYLAPALPALAIFLALGLEGWRVRGPRLFAVCLPAFAAWIGTWALALYAKPAWSFDAGQVGPYAASVTAGMTGSRQDLAVTWTETDASVGWSSDTAPAGPATLHLRLDQARFVAGTFEHRGLEVGTGRSGAYELPALLLSGAEDLGRLQWKLRLLPNREQGESVSEIAESPWQEATPSPVSERR